MHNSGCKPLKSRIDEELYMHTDNNKLIKGIENVSTNKK